MVSEVPYAPNALADYYHESAGSYSSEFRTTKFCLLAFTASEFTDQRRHNYLLTTHLQPLNQIPKLNLDSDIVLSSTYQFVHLTSTRSYVDPLQFLIMSYPRSLKGLCIGVLSGDRVIFQGPISKQTGLPIQKVLHLAGITTPKVDLVGGADEPFGYASRQYLRSRLVGQNLSFIVENKVGQIDIGHVIYDGEDISISLLEEGLAKVRGEKIKAQNADAYFDAQSQAKKDKINLWSTLPSKEKDCQRHISESTPKQIADDLANKTVKGIVEQVQPSKFVIYIPEKGYLFSLGSTELQVVVISQKTEGGQSKNNAKEIRTVLEANFLHREVDVHVRDLGGPDLISGYITHEGNDNRKIMLKYGYAKLSKDVINILDMNDFKQLKSVAQEAISARRGLWKDKQQQQSKTEGLDAKRFPGKALEVYSGDSLKVLNLETNEVVRIFLANVKAPQQGKSHAWEAKESLRKKVIGKKLKIELQFSRNINIKKTEYDKGEDKNFVFATVFQSGKNVGVLMLEQGLVTLQVPRVEDQFTKYFEDLKAADAEATKKKKGLHGEQIRIPVFNDVTVASKDGRFRIDMARAKTIYNFLKDQKRLSGIVQFVLNGSRFKIRMHQQSCYIVFVIEGIRALPNEPEYKKWSQAALDYSKQMLMQHDVEIELTRIDKKGVFLGNIFVDKKNYAMELLDRGLAFQFGRGFPAYEDAESVAKKNKVGMWSEAINLTSLKGEEQKDFKPVNFIKNLRLVEVVSAKQFYMEVLNSKKPQIPQKIEQVKQVKVGEIYAVKFTEDNVYYRGQIRKAEKNGRYFVHYIDYGNQEYVTIDRIGYLDKPLKDMKPALMRCGLYGIDNLSKEATTILRDYIDTQFKVEFKEEWNGEYNVILHDKNECLNEILIEEGCGECSQAGNQKWLTLEKKAKEASRGVWATGQNDD